MKHRFLPLLCATAFLFMFSSCGSSDNSSSSATASADTTSNPAPVTPAAPASTIVTTPTNMLTVRHEVSNYEQWKTSFDGHDTARVAKGVHSYVIGRGVMDSNDVSVTFKIDDVAKAKSFVADPSRKQAMQKAGVKGKPTMNFTTMVWMDTAKTNSDIRSRTTFMVKDFDAWRKSFESQKQARTDNGLADRAFGYDIDNHNKVTLVVVVNDTAKARAFWNSDQLKQMRAQSGVTSQPERFVYRVVQRY
ncbi:MAG: hypothetical protein ACJ75B_18685 [Flavisolibacter sp.]